MSEFTASPRKLFQDVSKSSTSDCLRYEVVADGGSIINILILFNTTDQDQLVLCYIKDVSSVDATVQEDEKFLEYTLTPKQTFIFKGPLVLNFGDKLGIKTLSDDVVNVFGKGSELLSV